MSNPSNQTYQCFIGVEIAYQDFTAALLRDGQKAKLLAPKPFAQSGEGFANFIAALHSTGFSPAEQLVVMEATGSYWVALAVALEQAGFAVSVINPAQAHFFAKAQLKRTKTDALDAITLAQLAQTLTPKRWIPPPQFYYELRQRLGQRDDLIKLLNQVENQLHALVVNPIVIATVRTQLENLIATLQNQIEQMDQELKSLLELDFELKNSDLSATQPLTTEQEWKKSIALLRTITGIGPLTACWLVLATLNFSTCSSVEALVNYVGLAPTERSSGSSIRGRPQIGHSGHSRLRTLLYLGTLSAARFNPVIKILWRRLREQKNKPSKVARCACARKLVHLAWAIVKSGKPFDPNYQRVLVPVKSLEPAVA